MNSLMLNRPNATDGPAFAPICRRTSGSHPYPSLPMAIAVSAMRLEKPHSLSYQERTLHEAPVDDLRLRRIEGGRVRDCG